MPVLPAVSVGLAVMECAPLEGALVVVLTAPVVTVGVRGPGQSERGWGEERFEAAPRGRSCVPTTTGLIRWQLWATQGRQG